MRIHEGAPFVPLAVEIPVPPDLPAHASILLVVENAGGAPVWSQEIAGERIVGALAHTGFLTAILPADSLDPGDARFLARRLDDPVSAPLLDVWFRVSRSP